MRKERIFLYFIIIILSILLGGHIYLAKYHHNHIKISPPQMPKIELPSITVNTAPFLIKHPYYGKITAIQKVRIIPYVNGYIDKILVKGGDLVQKNTPLFTISPHIYKAQVEKYTALYESATADYNNAKIYLTRVENTAKSAISKTEIDNAKASYLSAKAKLNSANAELKLAKINYDYTTVKAPITGIVGNIPVAKGVYVSANGEPLTSIIEQTPIRIAFSISNKEYLDLLNKNPKNPFENWAVAVKLPDNSIYPYTGVVEYVDNQVQSQTSSITVYAKIDNPHGILINNGFVNVYLQKQIKKAILIPQSAVHFNQDESFVYLKTPTGIKMQAVSLNGLYNQQYYITKGLKTGDEVITGNVPAFLLKK